MTGDGGKLILTTRDEENELAGEEEVTVVKIGDGGDQRQRRFGRRSGGREQEPQALHDLVTILLNNKCRMRDMITPEKEKMEAKEHFTDGVQRQ
jgi:hypothetical protein